VAHSNEPNPYLSKEEEDEGNKERFATIEECLEKKGKAQEERKEIMEKV
jgi:hypothetical protein